MRTTNDKGDVDGETKEMHGVHAVTIVLAKSKHLIELH